MISGGTLEVASGGILNGVRFEGGNGALVLDASASLHGLLVAGFGQGGAADSIDLKDIAFGTTKKNQLSFTEATNGASGTLTVTDGLHTASLMMIQYGATLTSSNFALASDGHGGTIIDFVSATFPTGGHGHGNVLASAVTSQPPAGAP